MAVRSFWCVFLLLLSSAAARAELVVGGSFDDETPFFARPGFQLTFGGAVGFRPTETVFLDRVDLVFRYSIAPPIDTVVQVRSRFDAFELLPGDVLESVSDPCTGCNTPEPELRSLAGRGVKRHAGLGRQPAC